ncbi:Deoxyribonuclease NucA/NucB [Nonomuraea solani]|uniref:Deoxyribonuclease NucA/NucB n=1 Tax=Nonomuraea solani TaxID=1144553 RepID=A0A1H5XXD1_9ACTN|nr:NucA/NucB deoxyribonuclease domain-containing protein [Nonomuraea solani]SEG16040.1 Deoxyribonuclease NucA/NucB [Nonomuraea solani]
MSRRTRMTMAVLLPLVLCAAGLSPAHARPPTPSPGATFDKVEPLSPDEARKRALRRAAELGNHSYYDADKVTDDGRSRQSLGRLATTAAFPATPPQPDTGDCLAKPEAARRSGWTYNRLLWCQAFGYKADYFKVSTSGPPTYMGSVIIDWQMAAMGSNTQRSLRVFWRPVAGSVRYVGWTTANPTGQPFAVHAECAQAAPYCSYAGTTPSKSWSAWNTTTDWFSWDLTSPAQAGDPTREKITTPDWHLVTDATSLDYPLIPPGKTDDLPFRCDSADYFSRFGQAFDRACVFTDVIPHLQYNLSSAKHGTVARHIQDAQLSPDTSYPIESHRKTIPGRWEPDPDPEFGSLHRVPGTGAIAASNTTWKNYACNRNGAYNATTGLPPKTPQQEAEGWQCDEYPFRSTAEGAGSGTWDFSVRWVPGTQNGSAGGSLIAFFFDDRILHVNDPFWVKINP